MGTHPAHVLAWCHSLKVARPDASLVSAATRTHMIPDQSSWRLAYQVMMRQHETPIASVEPAVLSATATHPDGTAIRSAWINTLPELNIKGKIGLHRVTSGVMEPGVSASRLPFILPEVGTIFHAFRPIYPLTCLRPTCGWTWTQRAPNPPVSCPRCHDYQWSKPRKEGTLPPKPAK